MHSSNPLQTKHPGANLMYHSQYDSRESRYDRDSRYDSRDTRYDSRDSSRYDDNREHSSRTRGDSRDRSAPVRPRRDSRSPPHSRSSMDRYDMHERSSGGGGKHGLPQAAPFG